MSHSRFMLEAAIREAVRECALRARKYPEWVAAGKMTRGEADYHRAGMEAARDILQEEWDRKYRPSPEQAELPWGGPKETRKGARE